MTNPFHRSLSWYFSKKSLPYWSILTIDSIIVLVSLLCGFWLACGGSAFVSQMGALLRADLLNLCFFMLGFRLFSTYSGVIRFSSFSDLVKVAMACFVGFALSLLSQYFISDSTVFASQPAAAIGIGSIIAVCMMWAERIWVKYLYDSTIHQNQHVKAFIYGTKNGGVAIAKSINSSESSPYIISGFVTDGTDLIDKHMMGARIYANDARLVENMKKQGAKVILVSPLKTELLRDNDDMINSLIEEDIKILMLPPEQEWDGKSDLSYAQLQEVNVEDLLPRQKIEVDMNKIGQLLRGKRILITGAAGSIGSEMVRQIALFGPSKLILIDQAETPLHDIRLMMARQWPEIDASTIVGDIANNKRMEEIFSKHKPEYVFHAAAYKHVPMMEDNPSESIENNVNGTRIIADLAVKYGTKKFVMVSTDKAVNPTNVMGCSKRICEIYVQALDKAIKEGKVSGSTQFITTRFGNVLGSNGSVIPLFEQQIKAGGPVTVTHPDIIRFFMLIPEACKLVLEAGTMGNGGEIYVFDMGKPVRIAELARRMIQLSGAKGVEIKFTGLRDGEKLYEEVLNDKEITLPTYHNKIKIAKVREYDYSDVNATICQMISTSHCADDMTIVSTMKSLVPEFKSQHSKYEALDK